MLAASNYFVRRLVLCCQSHLKLISRRRRRRSHSGRGEGGNGRMKPHSLIQREAFWSLYFILVFDKVYTFTRSHRIIYALQFLPCAWRAVPIFRAKNQIKHSSFMKSLPTFFYSVFLCEFRRFFPELYLNSFHGPRTKNANN